MIDYKNLADSVEFYTQKGFKNIEVPWTVSEYVDDITKPSDRIHYQLKHNNKCLVASGEQGFLYLYLKDYLPYGRFQTVTPCFRDEPYDLFHEKCFMKNELIITDDVSESRLKDMIDIAREFFYGIIGCPSECVKVIKTDEMKSAYDIVYEEDIWEQPNVESNASLVGTREIELGSYGIRKTEFLTWIYGTGCAEPRLSKCRNLYRMSHGNRISYGRG